MQEFEVTDKSALAIENSCTNCSKLLNVSPIFCLERNQRVETICGRCVNLANQTRNAKKWRQSAYENLAKFLTTPCSNKKYGCDVLLHWNDVESHEKRCTFQGIKCPLAQKKLFPKATCVWEGNINNFQKHVEDAHQDLTLRPLQVELSELTENRLFFTKVGSQIITVVIKYEKENTYYCLLMVNGTDVESRCYRYQLELCDEQKGDSIILRKSRLEPLAYMVENLNNHGKMLEIDMVKVKHMMKCTNEVLVHFAITKKSKKEIVCITGDKEVEVKDTSTTALNRNAIVDEKMLQELECPVCKEYMVPPIFICKTGHSICNSCKYKVTVCPNCRDELSNARNFTLENLTTNVNYPCRNKDAGCLFVTTSDKILAHQLNCYLSDIPCVLKCGWQGIRSGLHPHLKVQHPTILREADILHIFDTKDKNEIFFYIQYNGEMFRLSIKQEGEKGRKRFNVQQMWVGKDAAPKFRYQFQFIDHSPLGQNFSFANACRALTDLKEAHNTGIIIPWNLVQPFIFEDRYFYYKVVISKV